MIYKKLNSNIQEIIDTKVKNKYKLYFKYQLEIDLLIYFIDKNIHTNYINN